MYFITIPGDPVPKQRPRHNSSGTTYTPEKTRNYERQVKYCASVAMGKNARLSGPLKATLHFRLSVPASWPQWKREAALRHEILPTGKPDFDNLAKSVLDGMNGIVYYDDAQIVESVVRKVYSSEPGADIAIEPIGNKFGVGVSRNTKTGELQA